MGSHVLPRPASATDVGRRVTSRPVTSRGATSRGVTSRRPSGAPISTPASAAPAGDAEAIIDSLRRLVRHLRLTARATEESVGIAPAQLFVLSRLAAAPSSSIRELASRTLTDPSSVSVVVSKLEARKLVVRRVDPADKRRSRIELTARGRAALARGPVLPQVQLLTAIEALPVSRRRTISAALSELVRALGAEHTEPRLLFEDDAEDRKGTKRGRRSASKEK